MRQASRPSISVPAGATDCHFHVLGPYSRYPLDPGRGYTPPEASVEAYRTLAARLGLERFVLVQPSVYGSDNTCMLDAIRKLGAARTRAVAVIDDAVGFDELQAMDEAGVRGVRFNAISGNGTPLGQLNAIAQRIARLGWHLQLYVDGGTLVELAPALLNLPVDVVVDHMGQVWTGLGTAHPQFQALLRLVDSGKCWVKLCGYRVSSEGPPYADLTAPVRALLAAAPERCLWGTDWPHTNMEGPTAPDTGRLLDLLGDWAPDPLVLRRILVDNPAALYGF